MWPDGKPIGHRFTPLGEHALPAGITESDESVRERPGDRRPRPRAVLAGNAVETRHAVGTRLGDADDPFRPRRLEALGELGPRRVDHRLVAIGAGAGGPVVLGGADLALGERRFVEIDMKVVRVDAHPQMGGRRRGGEEARLDAHGQQGNRHVGSEPGDPVVELGERRRVERVTLGVDRVVGSLQLAGEFALTPEQLLTPRHSGVGGGGVGTPGGGRSRIEGGAHVDADGVEVGGEPTPRLAQRAQGRDVRHDADRGGDERGRRCAPDPAA